MNSPLAQVGGDFGTGIVGSQAFLLKFFSQAGYSTNVNTACCPLNGSISQAAYTKRNDISHAGVIIDVRESHSLFKDLIQC